MARNKVSTQQRYNEYWYNIYRKGLQYFDVIIPELKRPTKKSIEKAQRTWEELRKRLAEEIDEIPTIRQAYNKMIELEQTESDYRDIPRDENMNTAPARNMYDASMEVIQSFLQRIETVYQDTFAAMDALKVTDPKNALPYVTNYDEFSRTHIELVAFINQMLNDVGDNIDIVADVLKENGEIEYTEAVALIPPSNVRYEFEETLTHLQSIWKNVIATAEAKAIEEAGY